MPRAVNKLSHGYSVPEMPLYPADLEEAMQDTLSSLADVDLIYDLGRKMLDNWLVSEPQTERLLEEAKVVYQCERQPLIMRLADLHERMMSVTLFRAIH